MSACLHCGLDAPGGDDFCCAGCAAAYRIIGDLGLGGFYKTRELQGDIAPPRPDEAAALPVFSGFATCDEDGVYTMYLAVGGIHCASCVWLIENALARQDGVVSARLNMSTKRLKLCWKGAAEDADRLAGLVASLGYRVAPFDAAELETADMREQKQLLRCLAVAGFAAGNVMLLSVALWASSTETMGQSTRDLFHWLSALIALPAIAWAGQPFFRSALAALRAGRANMDVPVSVALVITAAVSLFETVTHGEHAYFDSAIMLLFFLLAGRYLDHRARGRARSAAHDLLGFMAGSATVIDGDGYKTMPARDLRPGMVMLLASGDRVPADGVVTDGSSEIDTSLITGESVPRPATEGAQVHAGTVNLGGALQIRVTAAHENTLAHDIARIMEEAERNTSKQARLAERIAGYYTPVVHTLALATFLGWWLGAGMAWQQALLVAVTVLIITCPCALGLAIPAVQVIAGGRLFRDGILLKDGAALERLASVDTIAFDKTGTLTRGMPEVTNIEDFDDARLQLAASVAAQSRHPLARAVRRAWAGPLHRLACVREEPGAGLEATYEGRTVRLGRAAWCGVEEAEDPGAHIWLKAANENPRKLSLSDTLRPDAPRVVATLERLGYRLALLSGDRAPVVDDIAAQAGIENRIPGMTPIEKADWLKAEQAAGHQVLMVGDGLNDTGALAVADVSMSPATAADIARTTADIVFQGDVLSPVATVLDTARAAMRLIRQNLCFALVYNLVAIPFAVAGFVTPLVAALAMSGSSLLVVGNALRLGRRKAAA